METVFNILLPSQLRNVMGLAVADYRQTDSLRYTRSRDRRRELLGSQ